MDEQLRVLSAQLQLNNKNTLQPELYMKGDKRWLLTFVTMIIKTTQRETNATTDEIIEMIKSEMQNLEINQYYEI